MKPYDIVTALENEVAQYCGSPYSVAVDSCTNALLLCFDYLGTKGQKVVLPKRTYVGVAYAVLNAGGTCEFVERNWSGQYYIASEKWPSVVVDSARRFTTGMYLPKTLMCTSCHWGKHLKIGRGGFILTDDLEAANALRVMRFDGRTAGVAPAEDNFIRRGRHCYMLPEEAARGLMLMTLIEKENQDLPWDGYPDLSQFPIFTEGYK